MSNTIQAATVEVLTAEVRTLQVGPAVSGAARVRSLAGEHDPDGQRWERYAGREGWRPAETVFGCPRIVAGKRCQRHRRHGADYERRCVCQRFRSLLDHRRMWAAASGGRVLTAEPYQFGGEDFAGLMAECSALGLDVTVTGQSPYSPGHTVMIIIRPGGQR